MLIDDGKLGARTGAPPCSIRSRLWHNLGHELATEPANSSDHLNESVRGTPLASEQSINPVEPSEPIPV
jgi:hypothetical protein